MHEERTELFKIQVNISFIRFSEKWMIELIAEKDAILVEWNEHISQVFLGTIFTMHFNIKKTPENSSF